MGAFAASLALHAVVVGLLWSAGGSMAIGARDEGADDEGADDGVEVSVAHWDPVVDAGPENFEVLEEQLPALSGATASVESYAPVELADPAPAVSRAAQPPELLPPNRSAERLRARYAEVLSVATRFAKTAMTAWATGGRLGASASDRTSAGGQSSQAGSPRGDGGTVAAVSAAGTTPGPTRGPLLAEGNSPPEYPLELRRAMREGTAWIHAVVESDGAVSAASVARTAGDDALDGAALHAVKGWRFHPAMDRGAPVRSEVDLPVVFRIKRR